MPKPFSHFLALLEEGSLHAELGERLTEMAMKLSDHTQNNSTAKGSLSVTFNLTLERGGVLSVKTDVKTKLPVSSRNPTVLWLDEHNNPVAENPRQQKLPLRSLESGEQKAKAL